MHRTLRSPPVVEGRRRLENVLRRSSQMGAPERFEDGGESEKTSRSRSYAIPATIAAGLAGATYMLVQNRRAKREREEVGPRAYEVFRQWSSAYPEERYRPPPVQLAGPNDPPRPFMGAGQTYGILA